MEQVLNLQISHNKKISALQKEFNQLFPFLKIEFFSQRHTMFKGSGRKDIVDNGVTLGSINRKQASGLIILKPGMKVSELEDIFKNNFGLSAQVFRRSGKTWLETTVTDDWTLEQQNEEGRELSSLSGSY